MVDEILSSEDLQQYLEKHGPREFLFLEGDPSRDVYMLISGEVEVLKGDKKVAEITDPGDVFGEMAVLLESERTASIRTMEGAEVLRIPLEDFKAVTDAHPEFSRRMATNLAYRLREVTKLFYGYKVIMDRFPDSVIMTDPQGRIISWNKQAESFYGLPWGDIKDRPAEELFNAPREFRDFSDELKDHRLAKDKVLTVQHPENGLMYVRLSGRSLVDGHNAFQGWVFVGHDVTEEQALASRYDFLRKLALPVVLLVLLVVGIWGYLSLYSEGRQVLDERRQAFEEQVAGDWKGLFHVLEDDIAHARWGAAQQSLNTYFSKPLPHHGNYLRVTLLDAGKTVTVSKAVSSRLRPVKPGTTYADLVFEPARDGSFDVVTLFRVDQNNPMGKKGVLMAFPAGNPKKPDGWVLLELDMHGLKRDYGLNEEDLSGISPTQQ